ncbi:MAG: methionine adenosyltransferase [Paludibacteraceae bacterium]|nr:methionine adenosyltransferase [Paludibacteraceae bacterium]
MGNYYFSSESVSEGHPDKVADQISDAIVDAYLAQDPHARVAVETLVTTGQVVLAGEVSANAVVDAATIAREVIDRIGYNKSEYKFDAESCGILTAIHAQSPDINRGVDRETEEQQGAGDQGMMFGYATNETDNYMPMALDLSHTLLKELADIRREGKEMTYLRPDAKAQVTMEYNEQGYAKRVQTIVISTQHDDFVKESDAIDAKKADEMMVGQIEKDVREILLPRVLKKFPQYKQFIDNDVRLLVNPTGRFVIGGPHGDTGLTGRKIIVDTYGGKGAHGGGAFSGKDPSKVDRSAAYATRHIAKNLVAAGVADEALVQVAYAIGVAEPMNLYVNTYGKSHVKMSDGEIAEKLLQIFSMTPKNIEKRLKLREPIYGESAAYGHMGRTPEIVKKSFKVGNQTIEKEVELFTWEKLDYVEKIKEAFGL